MQERCTTTGRLLLVGLGLLVISPARARAESPVSEEVVEQAIRLRDAALQDDTAWNWVEGLTTEVGPRLAGTPQEAAARDWTVRNLEALGFPASDIRVEPFSLETWHGTNSLDRQASTNHIAALYARSGGRPHHSAASQRWTGWTVERGLHPRS